MKMKKKWKKLKYFKLKKNFKMKHKELKITK